MEMAWKVSRSVSALASIFRLLVRLLAAEEEPPAPNRGPARSRLSISLLATIKVRARLKTQGTIHFASEPAG
jgi:hypothetical protein